MPDVVGLEELKQLRDFVDEEVSRQLETRLQTWRRVFYAFLTGLTLFFGCGLLRKEDVFKPIVETIYPPSIAFQSLKPNIGSLDLQELPSVDARIPVRVLQTMETATEDDYRKILQGGLFVALQGEFHQQMTEIFGTASHPNRVWAKTVMQWGRSPIPAVATIVDPERDGEQTACGKRFKHDEMGAILVIPGQAGRDDYRWFGCGPSYPLRTELLISTESRDQEGIRLVGVERQGRDALLEVRLSQAAAEALQLAGARDFTVKRSVRVAVSDSVD